VLPPGIKQVYLPLALTESQSTRAIADKVGGSVTVTEKRLVYEPALIGFASIRYTDRKLGLDETQNLALLQGLSEGSRIVSWKGAQQIKIEPGDLQETGESDATFVAGLPDGVTNVKAFNGLSAGLVDELYRSRSFSVAYNPTLKLYAEPDEPERDFRIRCQQVARELRDAALDKLRDKYEPKVERVQTQLAREERELAEDKAAYQGRIGEELLSGLSTVAGFLGVFGRRSASTRGLTTVASKRRITTAAQADIKESEAEIARMKAAIEALQHDMEEEAGALTRQFEEAVNDIQQVKVAPKKTEIDVQMVALAWAPAWEVTYEDGRGRSRTDAVPAYRAESV
jgi:hypothetical protein